jgi:hypothetical protein
LDQLERPPGKHPVAAGAEHLIAGPLLQTKYTAISLIAARRVVSGRAAKGRSMDGTPP